MLESSGLDTYARFFSLSVKISSGLDVKRISFMTSSSASEITFKDVLPKEVTSRN